MTSYWWMLSTCIETCLTSCCSLFAGTYLLLVSLCACLYLTLYLYTLYADIAVCYNFVYFVHQFVLAALQLAWCLADCCVPVSQSFRPPTSPFGQPSQTEHSAVSSQHIWHLRAFSVTGPTVWNSLPDSLRDPAVESERFKAGLENASVYRTLET